MLEMEEDTFLTIAYLYLIMDLLLRIFFYLSKPADAVCFQNLLCFWNLHIPVIYYNLKRNMTFILTFCVKEYYFTCLKLNSCCFYQALPILALKNLVNFILYLS